MTTSLPCLLLYFYVIFNVINLIQTIPKGYLIGASYDPASSSNSLFKIDPLSGKFTVLTPLTNYRAYDVTYDFIHKTFYVLGSETTLEKEAAMSVAKVNPFNGTKNIEQLRQNLPYGPDYLVGIDITKRKIISEITDSNLPAYLCYDNKTNAFYGMEIFQSERGCRLVRLNPYNGTMDILSKDLKDYEPSAGTCHEGYYFTMIVKSLDKQNIITFDLSNSSTIIANKPAQEYLDSFAFVPL
ncbi:unnamed protein product [Rotaria socialis]|uniref:Uncharacterized protein n=2 Tax=Rotaria socialis TaxID=392032 RepID=A0A821CRX6_9BILA|nr:unnamed protein product [Rotaria socialis]CAF4606765.1 unnamed protein product [Rotaria socialis]